MFPLIVMLALVIGGYAAYLVEIGEELNYQAHALAPVWYMFKPHLVTQVISDGGYLGTLAAVGMNIVHALLFSAVAYSLVTIGFAKIYAPRNDQPNAEEMEEPDPAVTGIYPCDIPGCTMMVMIPDSRDASTGAVIPGVKDTDPFEQYYLRCDRAPVATARPPESPIEKLQVAILELLKAHPEVPASVGHHHADASLGDHSIAISKSVADYMRAKGWEEPLARVAGLAHDIDKLLAYQQKGPGEWVKRKDATHHNTFSAYLVRQQPEFNSLAPEDRFTLTMALRYYHHPTHLPTNAGDRVERLISAIRHADGKIIQSEKAAGIAAAQAASNTVDLVASAVEKFLNVADINAYRGGQDAGWTKDAFEYVIMPMSRLIESLDEFLPNALARQMQLGVDSRSFSHPSIPVIKNALDSLGLLMWKVKDMESPTAMFDVRVGVKPWKACVLLNKDRISELLPTTVPKWGTTKYGNVKVLRPTLDKNEDDNETPDADATS